MIHIVCDSLAVLAYFAMLGIIGFMVFEQRRIMPVQINRLRLAFILLLFALGCEGLSHLLRVNGAIGLVCDFGKVVGSIGCVVELWFYRERMNGNIASIVDGQEGAAVDGRNTEDHSE